MHSEGKLIFDFYNTNLMKGMFVHNTLSKLSQRNNNTPTMKQIKKNNNWMRVVQSGTLY